MDESSVGVIERSQTIYVPKPRELDLVTSELSPFQKVEGSPRIWYVDVKGGGAAIFKRKHNEQREIKSDVENERAAYLISDLVGFDFVPTTVLRTVHGKEGSLTDVVEDAWGIDEVSQEELQGELYKYWIFRHVLRNPEGHDDNMVVKDGKIISLDHEASFDSDPPDPSYFDIDRNYYGVKAPIEVVNIFKNYLKDGTKQEILRAALKGVISEHDIEVTMQRLKTFGILLLTQGRINSKQELTGENLW